MKKLFVLLFVLALAVSANAGFLYPDYFIYVNRSLVCDINGTDLSVNNIWANNIDANSITLNYIVAKNKIDLNVLNDANFLGNLAINGQTFASDFVNLHADPVSHLQAATKGYVDMAVSGLEFDFFLTDSASDIMTYFDLVDVDTGEIESSHTSAVLNAGLDQEIFNFATEAGKPEFNTLLASVYDLHAHFQKSGGASKTVTVYWELWERDVGGTETELFSSEISSLVTTVKSGFDIHAVLAEDESIDNNRLVVKVFANVVGGGGTVQVIIYQEGVTASHISLKPPNTALSELFLSRNGTNWMGADLNLGGFVLQNGDVNATGDSNFTNIGVSGSIFNNAGITLADKTTFTGISTAPVVAGSSVYINPPTATTNFALFGIAVGGLSKLIVNAEGRVNARSFQASEDSNFTNIGVSEGIYVNRIFSTGDTQLGTNTQTSTIGLNEASNVDSLIKGTFLETTGISTNYFLHGTISNTGSFGGGPQTKSINGVFMDIDTSGSITAESSFNFIHGFKADIDLTNTMEGFQNKWRSYGVHVDITDNTTYNGALTDNSMWGAYFNVQSASTDTSVRDQFLYGTEINVGGNLRDSTRTSEHIGLLINTIDGGATNNYGILIDDVIDGTNNWAIKTNSTAGQVEFGGVPRGIPSTLATLYINPPSAGANFALLGLAVNDVEKFRVDEDGDVIMVGNLTVQDQDITLDQINIHSLTGTNTISSTASALTVSAFDELILSGTEVDMQANVDLQGSFELSGATKLSSEKIKVLRRASSTQALQIPFQMDLHYGEAGDADPTAELAGGIPMFYGTYAGPGSGDVTGNIYNIWNQIRGTSISSRSFTGSWNLFRATANFDDDYTGTIEETSAYVITGFDGADFDVNQLYGLNFGDITAGSKTNYAIKTGLGQVEFGDDLNVLGTAHFDGNFTIKRETDLQIFNCGIDALGALTCN